MNRTKIRTLIKKISHIPDFFFAKTNDFSKVLFRLKKSRISKPRDTEN